MADSIRVLVSGAGGKMGREVCRAVMAEDDMEVVAATDTHPAITGRDLGTVLGLTESGVGVNPDLASAIAEGRPDVMVDFTHPSAVLGNIQTALSRGVHCVIGTTGIDAHFHQIEGWTKQYDSKAFVAPNFTTGAVLMMHIAQLAAKYFPAAEIIEYHHDQKADAPSGTSVATAVKMGRQKISSVEVGEETFSGARGSTVEGLRVHSVRLPGYVAHQEVIFGDTGQTLTIRHDSIDRAAYMPGVVLAVRKIQGLGPFTVGLEKLMGLSDPV